MRMEDVFTYVEDQLAIFCSAFLLSAVAAPIVLTAFLSPM